MEKGTEAQRNFDGDIRDTKNERRKSLLYSEFCVLYSAFFTFLLDFSSFWAIIEFTEC